MYAFLAKTLGMQPRVFVLRKKHFPGFFAKLMPVNVKPDCPFVGNFQKLYLGTGREFVLGDIKSQQLVFKTYIKILSC